MNYIIRLFPNINTDIPDIIKRLPNQSSICIFKTCLEVKINKMEFIIGEVGRLIENINHIKIKDNREQKKILRELYGIQLKFEHDFDSLTLKIKPVENIYGTAEEQFALLSLLIIYSQTSKIFFKYCVNQRSILTNPSYFIGYINDVLTIELVNRDENLIADNYTLRYSHAIVFKYLMKCDLKKKINNKEMINLILKYVQLPLGISLYDIPDVKRSDLDLITRNVVFMTH